MQSSSKKIALIVGNGLTISFCKHSHNIAEKWNTSLFFKWGHLKSLQDDHKNVWDDFPFLKEILKDYKDSLDKSNYLIIADILSDASRYADHPWDNSILTEHIRHFLRSAFAQFHVANVDKVNFGDWPALDWFKNHKNSFRFIVNFNYDLLVETMLNNVQADFYRFGLERVEYKPFVRHCIPMLKPHGSIDFFHAPFADMKPKYPLENITRRSTADFFDKVEIKNLLKPTFSAELILPTEYSYQVEWPHIMRGVNYYRDFLNTFTDVIVVGLS